MFIKTFRANRSMIGFFCLAIGVIASAVFVATRVATPVFLFKKEMPVTMVEKTDKEISITINCSGDDKNVAELLSVLEQAEVKAGFFITGKFCDKFPESVKAIAEAGHDVGNMTFSARDMQNLSRDEIYKQIKMTDDKIEYITGIRPAFFRSPNEKYNDEILSVARDTGHLSIAFGIDSGDLKKTNAAKMAKEIAGKLKNGAIIKFDAESEITPTALKDIVEAIKSEGYTVVSLSQMVYAGDDYLIDSKGAQKKIVPAEK